VDSGSSLALRTDHYELTMVAASLKSGIARRRAVFEVFARQLPEGRAYGVMAGTDRIADAVERFRFDADTVGHLRASGVVTDEAAADWLMRYRFSGDITGYPDGELFFAYSPVLTVEGGFAECIVLETLLLSILNHDCAVAAAAARVRDAAPDRLLLEGGARRTDPEAAVAAARAAYIGGFDATSNLEAGRRWGVPTGGTTSHAFMLAHDDESAAFSAQCDALGADSTYLVDTFNLSDGIRRAVEAAGPRIGAVRVDSGDLLVNSASARTLLDELGAADCRIVASGDLDEYRIAELEAAEAPIDAYLVGTRMVTGSGHPTASLVYKLVAIAEDERAEGPLRAVGKLSAGKATIGGRKQVRRTVGADGFWEAEVLSPAAESWPPPAAPAPEALGHIPHRALMVGGEPVFCDNTAAARERCADRRTRLRPEDRRPHPLSAPAVPTEWAGLEISLAAADTCGIGRVA